jgi:beta-lactamase class A
MICIKQAFSVLCLISIYNEEMNSANDNDPYILPHLSCQYAFFVRRQGKLPVIDANADSFSSASLIKIPILLAWASLEQTAEITLDEVCNLDAEPQVKGAGFARWMRTRQISYHDVLLMMIATSDNLCANLAIQRVGMERLNALFFDRLGLTGTVLQRKLMDFEARARGLDNKISAQDFVRLFDLVHSLPARQKGWVETMLSACQDTSLLMRNLERDSLHFFHKAGSIPGVLHDWGYTHECDIFLLTDNVIHEDEVTRVFGQVGQQFLTNTGDHAI